MSDLDAFMVEVVNSIPNEWSCVIGKLIPKDTVVVNHAVKDTGILMARQRGVVIMNDCPTENSSAGIKELITHAQGMWPGFMTFDQAGWDTANLSLATVKETINHFLFRGYRGHLSFKKDYRSNEAGCSALCFVNFEPYTGDPANRPDIAETVPYVKLEWHEESGGSKEDIEPIIKTCRRLRLHEYIPAWTPVNAEE